MEKKCKKNQEDLAREKRTKIVFIETSVEMWFLYHPVNYPCRKRTNINYSIRMQTFWQIHFMFIRI